MLLPSAYLCLAPRAQANQRCSAPIRGAAQSASCLVWPGMNDGTGEQAARPGHASGQLRNV